MNIPITKILLLIPFIISCSNRSNFVDHTVYLYNSSSDNVYDFQVIYGEIKFPKNPKGIFDFGGGGQVTQYMEIPKEALINWKTEDNEVHKSNIEIRKNITKEDLKAERFKVVFDVNKDNLQVHVDRLVGEFEYERRTITGN